ncbi:MAG: Hsp20/alpha crystallin family protein [Acidobacteria bacterium]|nr:MAG: Hsp20/alpha crystallin family protein [Acidobacteriota bacterium]
MLHGSQDTFERLSLLKDRIARLFESASTRAEFSASDSEGSSWSPLVDLYETPEQVVLIAEVPGLSMKDLDVVVTDSALTVKGEGGVQPGGNEVVHHRVERSQGAFSRTFDLSAAVDRDKVTAEYRQGLLRVVLPKRRRGKPRSIQVQTS